MSPRVKAVIQYFVIIAATVFLVWFSLRGLKVEDGQNKWEYLLNTWRAADKFWLISMAVLAMISHVVRAYRWKMLIAPTGYKTTLGNSFLSLMIGYLVNMAIPRGGEVSRCYNLYKLDKTPVEITFGTVVVERITDVLCLLALIALAFLVEFEKLLAFLNTLPWSFANQNSKLLFILYFVLGAGVATIALWWFVKKNEKFKKLITKTWNGFKHGLFSVFKLENKGMYIFYSLLIWALYFLMSYTVILAFPQTNALNMSAVLSLFVIGSIAMAAPLPGGTGSYHTLVPAGLVFLYNIPETDAVAFTFIFHGWQSATLIVGGAVSLLISSVLIKKNSEKTEMK